MPEAKSAVFELDEGNLFNVKLTKDLAPKDLRKIKAAARKHVVAHKQEASAQIKQIKTELKLAKEAASKAAKHLKLLTKQITEEERSLAKATAPYIKLIDKVDGKLEARS